MATAPRANLVIPSLPGASQQNNATLLVKLEDGTFGQLRVQQPTGSSSCDSAGRLPPTTNLVPVFVRPIRKPTSLSAGVKRTVQDRRNESTISNAQRIFVVQSPKGRRDGVSPSLELVENSIVDEASLQTSMTKNRESLEIKLLTRPSRVHLVQQGILPSSSTPPRFHEQKVKLERARMGDVLKHKIEHRPDKQQLVSQHILLCESSLDPNIQEKQRQLKKCKLADSLNDKLAHRPGPLELVQENILHVDEALEQAVKDGRLQFKPTSAGMAQKHPNPVFLVQEVQDGVQQNGDAMSRQTLMLAPMEMPPSDILPISSQCHSSALSVPTFADPLSSPVSAPGTPRSGLPHPAVSTSVPPAQLSSSGSSAVGQKSKPKFKKPKSGKSASSATNSNGIGSVGTGSCVSSTNSNNSKSKIIKFHEYKGPTPSSSSNSKMAQQLSGLKIATSLGQTLPQISESPDSGVVSQTESVKCEASGGLSMDPSQETSYELLLHQQQLFLQWQLELQQKYPNSRFQLLPIWSGSQQPSTLSFPQNPPSSDGFLSSSSLSSSDTDSPGGGLVKQFILPVSAASSIPEAAPAYATTSGSDSRNSMNVFNGDKPEGSESRKQPSGTEKQKHNSSKPPVNPTKLEDLRVSDLKAECKKRNLPVSGPKPNLLEKLKPYAEHIIQNWKNPAVDTVQEGTSNEQPPTSSVQCLPPIQDVTAFLSTPPSSTFLSLPGVNAGGSSVLNQLRTPTSVGNTLLQASPAGSDLSRSVSTDTSGVASNYSSPGIDLSGLSFGGQATGGASTNCFTFAAGGSGGQFTLNTTEPVSRATCETPPSRIDSMSFNMDTSAPPSVSVVPPTESSPKDNPPSRSGGQQSELGSAFTSAMSATTLSVHEEMLRHQQRKIEELQRELQRSQEQLKHQQQVILAARKAQTEKKNGQCENKSIRESEAESWLANIDTKHLQKFHIQQFLQHKLQQQQLQQHVALQQELVATQRRLQDELGVEQAVQDVGRMIKQDPRAASLMVHLLRKYQQEKKEETAATKTNEKSSNNTSVTKETPKKNGGQQTGTSVAPGSTGNGNNGQVASQPKNGGKNKNRNVSGTSSKKTAAARSNSLPTSPSKMKSSLAGVDMEEIFKVVLDLASKATQKINNNNSENCSSIQDTVVKKKSDTQKLPSCDQLIPSLRGGTESEKGGGEMESDLCGSNLDSSEAGHSLGSLLMNNLPSAVDMLHSDPSSSSFVYTKNEAFEDLMEVLRNNGGEVDINSFLPNQSQNHVFDQGGFEQPATSSYYPNTFGAQELSELLGSDWLDSAYSHSHDVPRRPCEAQHSTVSLPRMSSAMAGTCNSSSMEQAVEDEFRHRSEQQSIPSVHSEPNLQHVAAVNSGGFDLGSSLENGEQMDWLDLILPSPAGLDLPPNPPGADSGFLEDEEQRESLMDTELRGNHPSVTRMLCYGRGGGSGNPVLSQNSLSHNGLDAFDLGVC